MARVVSSIESHAQRGKIIDAIASRQPYRDIEKWADPPVTRGSLSRFAKGIKDKTRDAIASANTAIANIDNGIDDAVTMSVTKAALVASIDPFQARAIKSDARRDRWMDAAEAGEKPDYRVLAALDRNDLTSQEYQARLANRLTTGSPTTVNVAIVCPGGQTSPEPAWSVDAIDIGKK